MTGAESLRTDAGRGNRRPKSSIALRQTRLALRGSRSATPRRANQ